MNKYELKQKVRRNLKENDLNLSDVSLVIEETLNVIMDTLAEGEDVNITGFGKFSTKFYEGYMGANPQDMTQTVEVKDHYRVTFKSGSVLKRRVNEWDDEE